MFNTVITNILILSLSSALFSQPLEKDEVMQPVKNLFLAMQTNDSTLAASLFTEDAILHTVYTDQTGKYKRATMPASKLVSAFGKPKEQVWSEPIWNEKVEVDGGLASVWVNYAFYIDSTFGHCGVDAFQLQKTEQGWKIFYLADTRRFDDCEVPEEIQQLYKK